MPRLIRSPCGISRIFIPYSELGSVRRARKRSPGEFTCTIRALDGACGGIVGIGVKDGAAAALSDAC
jgi:hypothetical protein